MSDIFWTENEYTDFSVNEPAFSFGAQEEIQDGEWKAIEEQAPEEPAVEEPKIISVREDEIDNQMDLADLIAMTTASSKKQEEEPVDPTLDYYNKNAEKYYQRTISADMSAQYKFFLKYLATGAMILDLCCGSGRDTKYFRDNGYNVTAIDGSEEMCRKAEAYTGIPVRNMDFLNPAPGERRWSNACHAVRDDRSRAAGNQCVGALFYDGIAIISGIIDCIAWRNGDATNTSLLGEYLRMYACHAVRDINFPDFFKANGEY